MTAALIAKLRMFSNCKYASIGEGWNLADEAADALEAKDARIAELEAALDATARFREMSHDRPI